MKKSGLRALIGLVVVVIVVILVYQNSGKNTAESGIAALQAIVETGEYTVAVNPAKNRNWMVTVRPCWQN